ncbi:carboxypeptidase-like regulatory domain-containing protein [Gemmata sp. JC717]|uniref:carboxypeptidase-like regulatory domain-containing protein n=1 Tax=Gemmata algarum TaxID=2975278 RepID=UPI0021BB1D4B|nr:carboxypeptidase-like regulatory domain-containing protein [Gemmata algarum]MDY3557367.1 carboxypeptidase-like regulatory domain-containing protein [Gemmata algarum]
MLSRSAAVLALLTCLLLVGCGSSGPKKYRVTGTVKYKGEPLKTGTITFRSIDGQHNGAGTIAGGSYDIPEVSGLPAGKYQVTISSPDPKAPQAAAAGGMPGDSSAIPKDLFPAKYNTSTELSAEIKSDGSNEIPFDLK